MEDHAHDPSLYERLRLLERLVRRQSVQLEADRERIAELTRQRAQEIVWDAGVPPPRPRPTPAPPKRHRRPNPHGLHIVPGFVAAGLGWVWATRLRRVVTVGVSTAALTTGAVTPAVIPGGPSAHAGQGPVSVRHHHPQTSRPSPQPSDKRRKPHGRSERHSPGGQPASAGGPQGGGGGTPSPAPSPVVSPLPAVPTPTPIPTPPLPTPQVCLPPPLCDQLNQCCDDDNTQHPLLGAVTQTRAWLIAKHRLRLAA